MSRKTEISKQEVNELPLFRYEKPIHLVEDPEAAAKTARRLAAEKVVGFDTETRPSFRKGEKHQVSLLQMAGSDGVHLFRLKRTGLPPELTAVFECDRILKVGIAIRDDLIELKTLGDFQECSVVDLNDYFQDRGYASFGARKLTALILGFRISKSQQTSNWDAPRLSGAQRRYAATDAYVCREIYLKQTRRRGK